MTKTIHPDFVSSTSQLDYIIKCFDAEGTLFTKGRRNTIKVFDVGGRQVNVKAFGIPNIFNKIAYRFLRSSKAQRSFDYATVLLQKGIGTPQPIGFYENSSALFFKDSYYISENLQPDLTYRELVEVPDYPEHDIILRQFTRFSFMLHEKGIDFKDHTPGNTLIKKLDDGSYAFYLVDLNRMAFPATMDFDMRMENLKRLTPRKEMVAVMSNEYAKLYDKPEAEIFEVLWHKTSEFQRKFWRKRMIKKRLKFWKK